MTRKRRRLMVVLLGLAVLGTAVGLVLVAMEDSLVFFYSPSDLVEKQLVPGQRIRIGGLVEEGSVGQGADALNVNFRVTDLSESVAVTYTGVMPDLFREGQGVVVEGRFGDAGTFEAISVLAKHDETYMPPEVADALKRAGTWQGNNGDGETQP